MTDGSTCVYPGFHDINNVLASDQGNSGASEDKVRSQVDESLVEQMAWELTLRDSGVAVASELFGVATRMFSRGEAN